VPGGSWVKTKAPLASVDIYWDWPLAGSRRVSLARRILVYCSSAIVPVDDWAKGIEEEGWEQILNWSEAHRKFLMLRKYNS